MPNSLWPQGHQTPLSSTISQNLLKFMSIESVMLSKHLILCCLLLLPSIFPSIHLFQWVRSLHQVAKILELQHQSFQWIFRVDWLVWSPYSPVDSQGSSPAPQLESTNSLVLNFLCVYLLNCISMFSNTFRKNWRR